MPKHAHKVSRGHPAARKTHAKPKSSRAPKRVSRAIYGHSPYGHMKSNGVWHEELSDSGI